MLPLPKVTLVPETHCHSLGRVLQVFNNLHIEEVSVLMELFGTVLSYQSRDRVPWIRQGPVPRPTSTEDGVLGYSYHNLASSKVLTVLSSLLCTLLAQVPTSRFFSA